MELKIITEFLKAEIRKPLHALKKAVILSLKFIALGLLRFVLWGIFFFLPFFIFLLFAFHWVTNKARIEFDKLRAPYAAWPANMSEENTNTIPFGLNALSRDIRFWLRELERLKR